MQSTKEEGVYSLSLEIPDSLIGEKLVYIYVVDTSKVENLQYGARVVRIPEVSETLPVVYFNEFGDATDDQVLLSPPISVFRTNADSKGILIDFKQNGEFPGTYSDLTKYRQVVNNLISNAIKYYDPDKD